MKRIFLQLLILLVVVVAAVWVTRALMSRDLPDLQSWHKPILDSEFKARKYPNGITFEDYQKLETQLVAEIEAKVESNLTVEQKVFSNRFYHESPAHRSHWATNWNLSYERRPAQPIGGVVLLHGSSDSPYSMRALAEELYLANYYVVAVRLPGNGTIPGELTSVEAKDWQQVVPMGVIQARAQIGDQMPVFIGGYSTGASLAVGYAIEAATNDALDQVDGLLLFSPAMAISRMAQFATWDNLFSRLPMFRKFAWMNIWPEYDPFKYASFPKRAGAIVRELTQDNLAGLEALRHSEDWKNFPPVVSFQSIVDTTVFTSAVIDFHGELEHPQSQLVLFDVNRNSSVIPFLQGNSAQLLVKATEDKMQSMDVTIVRNQSADSDRVAAYRSCQQQVSHKPTCIETQLLDNAWPPYVMSLSHVALPFPPDDSLYGSAPTPTEPNYNLNHFNVKGEKHVLVVPAEDIHRLRHNPFFDYMSARMMAFLETVNSSPN